MTPKIKTFRRDKLRRLVEAGRVTAVGSYHFDDMYGESRDTAKNMPVAMKPADWKDRKEGTCYLTESDFTSDCGRAWENENGTITLYVHSNSNFDLKINPERSSMKVRVGSTYFYKANLLDAVDGRTNLVEGDEVRVVNLHGAPKANTMGHCHVETLKGEFVGLVCTNSLHTREQYMVYLRKKIAEHETARN
jgi:hypothetical protein